MKVTKVWTFFYGSYINFEVLKEVDLVPERWEVARLGGFDIRIEPRANLVQSDTDVVYGIAATATHEELTRLYVHAKDWASSISQSPCSSKHSKANGGQPCATSVPIWNRVQRIRPMSSGFSAPLEPTDFLSGTWIVWLTSCPDYAGIPAWIRRSAIG